jgi:hypothetical protein
MKILISFATALVATYVALAFALGHYDTLSSAACTDDFTLPGIACRFAGFGVTLALVPLCGVIVGFATWILLVRRAHKQAMARAAETRRQA